MRLHNELLLQQVSPTIRAKVAAVIKDMEGHGLQPTITEALRTPERQRMLVKQGRSKTLRSRHLPDKTGHSRAVDIVDTMKLWNAPRRFWLILGASATAHGLQWGGFYGLNRAMRKALLQCFEDKAWDRLVKVGWDPAHIEQ